MAQTGIALNSVHRSVFDGLCWSGLRTRDWWHWQGWLHWTRLRCAVTGHPLVLYDIGVTCTRCDFYALVPREARLADGLTALFTFEPQPDVPCAADLVKRRVCPTSQTSQCTCPPNGICNDCTVPLDRW